MRDDTLEFGVVGDVLAQSAGVTVIDEPHDHELFVGAPKQHIVVGALELEAVQKSVRSGVLGHRNQPPPDGT